MPSRQKKIPPVSAGELAYVLNVSAETITTLKKGGVISPVEGRKYDLQECVKNFIEYKSGTGGTVQGRRAKLVAEQARKLTLQNDALEGTLIKTDTAIEIFNQYASALAGGLSALPGRVCQIVAGKNSANEIKQLLKDEITQLLNHAAKPFETLEGVKRKGQNNNKAGGDDNAPAPGQNN